VPLHACFVIVKGTACVLVCIRFGFGANLRTGYVLNSELAFGLFEFCLKFNLCWFEPRYEAFLSSSYSFGLTHHLGLLLNRWACYVAIYTDENTQESKFPIIKLGWG
jgi:hypothetical protein